MAFVETNAMNNFDISTIATTIGSRHPFLTSTESDKYIASFKTKHETIDNINAKFNLYKDWVIDQSDLRGTDIRVAKRVKEGYPTIDACALIDVFDRKVE